MSHLTTLLINMITADPNQPRKFFDESSMAELTESVKANGILQPILVRPNAEKPGYLLVCGERRLRAAKEAGLTEIPAVIRELSNDEALEVQIVENLQRKDVNPMEEAVAFKSLAERFEVEEIAAKVGKSKSYVAQRLSLNNLIPALQEVLYAGKILVVDAYKLARSSQEAQKEVAEDIPKGWKTAPNYTLQLSWRFKDKQLNLMLAPFDTSDANLYPKAGACTNCQFNSSFNTPLFPDLANQFICSNATCYSVKADKSFKKAIEEAATDPDVVFIRNGYGPMNKEETAKVTMAKNLGLDVKTLGYSDIVQRPEPVPVWEAFLEQKQEEDEDDLIEMTEKEKKEWIKDRKKDWEDDLKTYQEDLARFNDPKLKRAFVVAGEGAGTFIRVKPLKKEKAETAKGNAGPSVDEDIDQQITGLKEKERRATELDQEKIVGGCISLMGSRRSDLLNSTQLTERETSILIFAMCAEKYEVKDHVAKILGVKSDDYNNHRLYQAIVKDNGKKLIWEQIFRLFIFQVVARSVYLDPNKYGTALASRDLAEEHFPAQVAEIVRETTEKAVKRGEVSQARIKALLKKKAEAKPSVALKKIKK